MQPVNCFWVGLGVCSSYHSEKEKESFIVEEKKKTAALALIVGGVFSFRALLQLNNVLPSFRSLLYCGFWRMPRLPPYFS